MKRVFKTERRVLQGLGQNITRVRGRTNKNGVEPQKLGEGLTRTWMNLRRVEGGLTRVEEGQTITGRA